MMVAGNHDSFEPIPNPYIVGKPIEDRRMFFGREADFTYIKMKVTGQQKGGLLVLCGTRRSGKTSILFQIKGGRLGDGFVPVLIDMQSMTVQDDREFLDKLAQEVLEALDDPELSYERDYASRVNGNPFTAFQDLIGKINTRLAGRNLILLFDEYELFETHIDKGRFSTDILNVLANWVESRHGVFIVFTGSDKLETRNSRYWEAFLGKALHRRISFLSKSDTLRLIHEPVRGIVEYDPHIPEAIHHLTAGQPFYSQVICQSLVDHLNESRKRRVTDEDVQLAVDEIIENPLPQMIFSWSSLLDIEKLTLSIIAELAKEDPGPVGPEDIHAYLVDEDIGYRLDPAKLNEALERLFQDDLLEKDERGEIFHFKMDLWRQWITRMHSIWQVIEEIGGDDRELGEGIQRLRGRTRLEKTLLITAGVLAIAALPIIYFTTLRREEVEPVPAAPYVLVPDSTVLTVRTEPSGAQVFLDDRLLGNSPVVDKQVLCQKATLRLDLAGYKGRSFEVLLNKDEALDTLVTLTKMTGAIAVTSQPAGAQIYLDGRRTDFLTPHTFSGLEVLRRYGVTLTLPGYDRGSYPGLEVADGGTTRVDHSFAQTTHPLSVITEPEGAEIHLDGRYLGVTPRTLLEVTEGRHELRFGLAGYQEAVRTVDVGSDDSMVRVTLEPLPPGFIKFEISPYAELWIDGKLVKQLAVSETIELPPGIHECQLRHPHLGTEIVEVEVPPGKQVLVRHQFGN